MLIGLVSVMIALGALEVVARYQAFVPSAPGRYLAISKAFSGLGAFLADRKSVQLVYSDYQLYAHAPVSTPTITITPYYSSRNTPASFAREAADTIVWTFGGSTMQNFETTDELSIANTIAKTFVNRGVKPRVENFGLGSFQSSLELVQFSHLLAQVPERERPAIAIFYDGFNDPTHGYLFGAGAIQRDLSEKLGAVVEHHYGSAALYASSAWLAQYSVAWTALIHNRLQRYLFGGYWPNSTEDNLERTVAIYLRNVTTTEAVCGAYRIHCFFVLQPLVVTKTPLTEEETVAFDEVPESQVRFIRAFYARTSARLGENPNFIDASHILDGRKFDDFYDLGHTGALSSPVIGEKIGTAVLDRYLSTPVNRQSAAK